MRWIEPKHGASMDSACSLHLAQPSMFLGQGRESQPFPGPGQMMHSSGRMFLSRCLSHIYDVKLGVSYGAGDSIPRQNRRLQSYVWTKTSQHLLLTIMKFRIQRDDLTPLNQLLFLLKEQATIVVSIEYQIAGFCKSPPRSYGIKRGVSLDTKTM